MIEPLLAPQEVDFVTVESRVDLWPGESLGQYRSEETALEGLSACGGDSVACEAGERGRSAAVLVRELLGGDEGGRTSASLHARSTSGAGECGRQVEQGADGGGDGGGRGGVVASRVVVRWKDEACGRDRR